MRLLRWISLLVAAFLVAGCFNLNVNVPDLGGDGGPEADSNQLPDAGASGGWKDLIAGAATQVMLAAEHGVLFYAYDTLAYPNSPVQLAARLQSAKSLKGLAGVTIGFYKADELILVARTNKDGLASVSWTPPGVGDYSFTARIISVPDDGDEELLEVSPSRLLVASREKETELVVIDLDHTLVDSSFFKVLMGGGRQMRDSAAVTGAIAKRYGIIYLTHRPELMTNRSKSWLVGRGYPAGPVMLSELKKTFGDSGEFKTAKLAAVRKTFPNVRIGIGDKLSDAQAYVDNGLTAYLIPHYKEKPEDMRKLARQISGLRGRGRLHVVSNWRAIEAGIFDGRAFPPEAFASYLRRRADQIEAEKKARQEREKRLDDDD